MGLPGDQQNPEPVAHPVDVDHRPVVQGRKLVRDRRHLQLEDRRAGVLEDEREPHVPADGDEGGLHLDAVAAQADPRHLPPDPGPLAGVAVLDAVGDADFLADDAVTGRLLDDQAAVRLAAGPGQQHVQRPGRQRRRIGGNVVDLPVGDQDGAGEALAGDLGQGLGEGGEQAGAALGVVGAGAARADDPQLQIVETRKRRAHGVQRRFALRRAPAHRLAVRLVDHDHGHVGPGLAVLAHRARIDQSQHQNGQGGGAQRHAPPAAHGGDGEKHRRRNPEQGDGGPGEKRGEAEAVAHCVSLFRIAGRWTWSDL